MIWGEEMKQKIRTFSKPGNDEIGKIKKDQ